MIVTIRRRDPGSVNAEKGFTLIEVMVSLLLLAIGVLGAAAMQLYSLKSNQVAGVHSQAVYLANSIAEAMRANMSVAKTGVYVRAIDDPIPAVGTSISSVDLNVWLNTLRTELPSGTGSISAADASNRVTITVRWDESRLTRKDASVAEKAADQAQTFSLVTQIWN
jgi:type IV pilus assembly protein PilV